MKSALQFIGTQRSGSNLLRVMLNQHPEISAPHPPHILQVMMPLLKSYGDLKNDSNFARLVDDVCTLVELNPVDWKIKFNREDVIARCENRSSPQAMKAVYEVKAGNDDASVWCCKSMASVHYVNEIEAAGIHPVYIFMYRDGRDVACSFRKAVVGEKHIYHLAQQWKQEQELSWQMWQSKLHARMVTVRYEDLIIDPVPVLSEITAAIGLEYHPDMLKYSTADEAKVTASSGKMWSNLTKPVMSDNTNKFLRELSHEDLVIFESVAGDTLEKLGYQREIPADKLRTFTEDQISEFGKLNDTWKAEAKVLAVEDMSKRKPQDDFIAVLKRKAQDVL